MRTRLSVCTAMIMLCPVAYGDVLTFDGVPSGTQLRGSSYALDHRISPSSDFQVTDHSGSGWGPPHSGNNVLTSVGSAYSQFLFGRFGPTYPGADWDHLQSVSAYFSTQPEAMVRVMAYHYEQEGPHTLISSVVIGGPGESWSNRYVQIGASPSIAFEILRFEGVNSPDDLLGFCLDDMTITLVPEPSSLLALAGGLGGLAGMVFRRRRNRQ